MSKTISILFEKSLSFVPAFLWAGCIYYLSAQQVLPGFSLNVWDFLFKKSAHIFVYAVLYLLLFRAFKHSSDFSDHRAWSLPLLLTLAYACFDEIHQMSTPGRHGSLRDVGFDALGCSLVMMRKFGYI